MLLEDYQQTAFHNLLMGKERTAANLSLGGTCSDKTLHFKSVLAAEGIQTKLHTALINGRATHRLLSVQLLGKLYFIDVGSGWPCVQLFPAFQSYSYSAFGIHFRTKLHKEQLVVDINTHTEFKPLMVIPLQAPSQEEIQAAIANRYHPSKEYPFSHSLRLSFVKGQQFYFIKGNRLRIYQAQATCIEQELSLEDIKEFIAMHVPQLSAFYHTRLFLDY
jgi:arylamine N-acetyltransferase